MWFCQKDEYLSWIKYWQVLDFDIWYYCKNWKYIIFCIVYGQKDIILGYLEGIHSELLYLIGWYMPIFLNYFLDKFIESINFDIIISPNKLNNTSYAVKMFRVWWDSRFSIENTKNKFSNIFKINIKEKDNIHYYQ